MTPRPSRTSFAPPRVARGNLAWSSRRRVPPNPPRQLRHTLLAGLLLLALPGAARAQLTAPSASSSSCPVDISRVRLDDTLGEPCDESRSDFCVSCVCDFSLRLVEAGYRLTGEDAVPFQACAMANIVPLQRAGLTVSAMMAVASRCTDQPPCVAEYEARFFPPPNTAGAASDPRGAPGPASAPDHTTHASTAALSPPRDPLTAVIDASASNPRDGLDGAVAPPRLRPPVSAAVAAVVVVVASLAAWAIYAARERLRRRLRAAHSDDDANCRVERLTFENITCVAGAASRRGRGRDGGKGLGVSRSPGARVLLRGVTGACHRGEMLALMGPSGAGKSTLLNVISGRTDPGSGVRAVGGSVRVDGASLRPQDLSRRVAFVPQRDAHMLPFLTVFETVMYSAELQLPWYAPRDEKRARTMATLEELALTRVANSRVGGADAGTSAGGGGGGGGGAISRVVRAGVHLIGTACRRRPRVDADGTVPADDDDPETTIPRVGVSPGGGDAFGFGAHPGGSSVSGGERRRVAVAMELVTSPDILALDEPTSGLDAAAAAAMVFTLRDLASRGAGRVVVLSVHQPSPRAFRALDRVLLLGAGGVALWYGSPSRAEAHFAAIGLPCPEEDLAAFAFARGDERRAVNHRRGDATVASSNPEGIDSGHNRYRVDVSEWMLEVASDPTARETLIAGGSQSPPRDDVSQVSSGDAPAGTDGVGSRGFGRAASPGPRRRSAATEFRVLLARSAATTTRDPSLLVAHLTVATLTAVLLGCIYLDSPRTLAGFQNRAGGIFFTLVFFGLASASAGDRLAAEAAARDREIRSGYHGAGSYVLAALVIDILALRAPAAAVYAVVLYHMMGLRAGADAFFTFLGLLELFVAAAAALCAAVSLAARNPAVANLIATFTLLLSAMFGGFLVSIQSVPKALRWLQWLSPYRYAWGAMLSNEMRGVAFLFDTDFEGAAVEIEVDGQTYLNTFGLHPRTIARDASALAGIIAGVGVLAYLALVTTTGGWARWGTGDAASGKPGGSAKRRG